MILSELTEAILAACFEVSNELGVGFVESVYEKALMIALKDKELEAENQHQLTVSFRNENVGCFYADIIVNKTVILELKAVKSLLPEHQAQLLNYLKASGLPVGLLINFGMPQLEYRRFDNKFNRDRGNKGDLF
ncbi:GxxExxY protein [Trichlorobacter lovleyi]|uniref:GxxExxY protein n=1 Tax=Trichlorobacter lovleyi TaxID=313985 RepID=UPI0023EF9E9C|nr:GxxExxY protein [Trichlorobacter lovleyi]